MQVGAAARAEVERWGWAAATQVVREQQYARAIERHRRRADSKRRFGLLRLRVGLVALLRGYWALVWAFLEWSADQLDYARHLRPAERQAM